MRRKEFSITDRPEIEQFLSEMSFGFLGTINEDGFPDITPLNFVYYKGSVYFHGSKIGQKFKNISHHLYVTFAVASEYALLPSYFTDPNLACPASAFFKSVIIKGNASIIDDLEEKAEVFMAFMEKLQPEGGYQPIEVNNPDYKRNLKGVMLVKISTVDISAKFKFGQNLNETKFNQVIAGLEKRGAEKDQQTIDYMKRLYRKKHDETK
jgi:uncharacterized protein